MPYYAGRMLASKIAYYARHYAGRIYPRLAGGRWLTLPGCILLAQMIGYPYFFR